MRTDIRDFPVTCALMGLCIVAFVALELLGMTQGYAAYNAGVLTPAAVFDGRWWTLLTSMFLHGGVMHLLCNMVTLWYVGSMIEDVFGPARYLALYFFAGLAGGLVSVAYLAATGQPDSGVVGASGALFGLFGAYAYLLVREHRSPVLFLSAPSWGDVRGVLSLVVVNIVIGFAPGIAMEAHLGGLAAGLVLGVPLYEQLRASVQRDIDAGLEPPSAPRMEERYDFDEMQAAQDAAMAAREAYAADWDAAKPAEREQLTRDARDDAVGNR